MSSVGEIHYDVCTDQAWEARYGKLTRPVKPGLVMYSRFEGEPWIIVEGLPIELAQELRVVVHAFNGLLTDRYKIIRRYEKNAELAKGRIESWKEHLAKLAAPVELTTESVAKLKDVCLNVIHEIVATYEDAMMESEPLMYERFRQQREWRENAVRLFDELIGGSSRLTETELKSIKRSELAVIVEKFMQEHLKTGPKESCDTHESILNALRRAPDSVKEAVDQFLPKWKEMKLPPSRVLDEAESVLYDGDTIGEVGTVAAAQIVKLLDGNVQFKESDVDKLERENRSLRREIETLKAMFPLAVSGSQPAVPDSVPVQPDPIGGELARLKKRRSVR